jgi:hypothetical protein
MRENRPYEAASRRIRLAYSIRFSAVHPPTQIQRNGVNKALTGVPGFKLRS